MLHVSRDICTCKQQRAKIMPYQHERHTQTCCMPCVSQASASNPPMKGCVSFSTHAFAWGSIVFEHVTCHLRLKPIQAVAWSVSNCLLQPRRHMHTSWMSYACSVHVNNCMPKPCLSKRWHHMQEYSISSPPRAQVRTYACTWKAYGPAHEGIVRQHAAWCSCPVPSVCKHLHEQNNCVIEATRPCLSKQRASQASVFYLIPAPNTSKHVHERSMDFLSRGHRTSTCCMPSVAHVHASICMIRTCTR